MLQEKPSVRTTIEDVVRLWWRPRPAVPPALRSALVINVDPLWTIVYDADLDDLTWR